MFVVFFSGDTLRSNSITFGAILCYLSFILGGGGGGGGGCYGVFRHFQQYLRYIVTARFIGGENCSFPEKITDLPHNDVSSTPRHERDSNSSR